MWRAQVEYLDGLGVPSIALDLPAHGARRDEEFTLDGALATIDDAVKDAAASSSVLLIGHSMGGLLATAYTGARERPPVAGLVGASCTALPRGSALAAYRFLSRSFTALPDNGAWFSARMLAATLPVESRGDFGAGGYAYEAQDTVLASLPGLDLPRAIARIRVPTWWVNGSLDQLRRNEELFHRLAQGSELIVVPRTTHLLPVMRPRVFNAVLGLAIETLRQRGGAES